jgi:hypothetical protein
MVTPEIINYIRQQIAAGVSREQISINLKQNGWNDLDIAEAFNATTVPLGAAPLSLDKKTRQTIRNIIIFICVLVILFIGFVAATFFIKRNAPVVQSDEVNKIETSLPKDINFNDFKVALEKVPDTENSVAIFNALPQKEVTSDDRSLMNKYIAGSVSLDSSSLKQTKAILVKYKNVLDAFDAGAAKKYFQCPSDEYGIIPGKCPLNSARDAGLLVSIKSLVLSKDGKVA